MSTNTSRGRISKTLPLTMLPSLKSRRDFAISSCISVIKELRTSTNHGLPKFSPNRAIHEDRYSRNQREAKDSHSIQRRKRFPKHSPPQMRMHLRRRMLARRKPYFGELASWPSQSVEALRNSREASSPK